MNTKKKIQEGLEQVSNENFYKPLKTPLVSSTMAKVGNIVKTLFDTDKNLVLSNELIKVELPP